jgi:hypothetical protein
MKQYKKLILIIIIILTILTTKNVQADTVTLINNGYNITSLSVMSDGKMLLDMSNESTAYALLKYDQYANTVSRDDRLLSGTMPKQHYSMNAQISGTYPTVSGFLSTYFYDTTNDYEYYVSGQYNTDTGYIDYYLYQREIGGTYWAKLPIYSTSNVPSGVGYGGALFKSTARNIILSRYTQPNREFQFFDDTLNRLNKCGYTDLARWGIVLKHIGGLLSSGEEIYTTRFRLDNPYTCTITPTLLYGYGGIESYYAKAGAYQLLGGAYPAIMLHEDGGKIFKTADLSNTSGTIIDIATNPTCAAYMTSTAINLSSMDCASLDDCIFVGIIGDENRSIALRYNGIDCDEINITGVNPTNRNLYGITYNNFDGKYYVFGDYVLFSIISDYSPPPTPPSYGGENVSYAYHNNKNFTVYLQSSPYIRNLDGSVTITNPQGFSGLSWNYNDISNKCIYYIIDGGPAICAFFSAFKWNKYTNNPSAFKIIGTTGSLDPPSNYVIVAQNTTSYMGKVCQYTETLWINETYPYTGSVCDNGWQPSGICEYNTTFYDTYNPVVISLNSTIHTDIYKSITPEINNTEVDFNILVDGMQTNLTEYEDSILFSIKSNTGQDISPLLITFNSSTLGGLYGDTCIRYYTPNDNITSSKLLWCYGNYKGFIQIQVFINWQNKTFTINSQEQNQESSTSYKSKPIDFYYKTASNIGRIYFNPSLFEGGDASYIGSPIIVSIIPTLETSNSYKGLLDKYDTDNVQFSCIYTNAGLYPTRFYNNFYYPQALNNYDDWISYKVYDLTGQTSGIFPTGTNGSINYGTGVGNYTNNFLNSLLPSDATGGDKLLYAVFIIFIALVGTIIILAYGNASFELNIPTGIILGLGGLVSVALTILFGMIGWIPAWILIVFFIIAAAIIGVMFKNIFVSG